MAKQEIKPVFKSDADRLFAQGKTQTTTNILGQSGAISDAFGNTDFGKSKYDDSNLDPTFITNGDYKYHRGEAQSNLEKWGAGISRAGAKLGVRTLNGVISPLYGVGSAIKNADWSKIWDNDVTNLTLEAEKKIDDSIGLYSTKAAEDAKGFNKLAYVNTWAGDVLDGISYSGAAMLSGGAYSKLLGAASKLASLDKLGMSVAETLGMTTKIEDAADKTKFVIELTDKANKLKNGLNNGALAAIGAATESSANALNDANEFERQMLERLSDGGRRQVTDSEKEYIKQLRKSVGNSSYAMNMPVIMASNWLTFGKTMLGNSTTEKTLLKDLAGRTEKDLATGSYKASIKSPVQSLLDNTYGLRKVAGKAVPEGFEEWEQLLVTKGVNDYYTKKYFNPEYNDFQASFSKGLNEAMSSEGLENFLVGAISGGIFGNATQIRSEGLKSYKNPYNDQAVNQTLEYLNSIKGKDAYKDAVEMLYRHGNISEKLDNATAKNDNFEINNNKSDLFINYVNHMINAGKTEDLKAELNSYKKLSNEEFEGILGIKLGQDQLTNTKESVNQYISKRIDKIGKIEQLSNSIDELHPNLPKNIKDRFMYTAWTLEDAQDRIKTLQTELDAKLSKYGLFNGGLSAVNIMSNLEGIDPKASLQANAKLIAENKNISPLIRQEVEAKTQDLIKLVDRQDQFMKEFAALSNPKVQESLNKVDQETENKIADVVANDINKQDDKDAQEEAKAQMAAQFAQAEAQHASEKTPIDINSLSGFTEEENPLDEMSQLVANKIINRTDSNEQLTPEEQEVYDNDKEAIESYIQSKAAKSVEQATQTLTELNNVNNLDAKKADIERRRQEELNSKNQQLTDYLNATNELAKRGDIVSEAYDKLIGESVELSKQGKQDEANKIANLIDYIGRMYSPEDLHKDSKTPISNYLKEAKESLDRWMSSRGQNTISGKINAKYDAELAALESNIKENIEFNDQLSNGITQSVDDKLDVDNVLSVGEKEFTSKRANALMMKFFQFIPGTKAWERDENGEVIEESNPDVSKDVNNPNVALAGTELTIGHDGEAIFFEDAEGRTIGFLGLPHPTTSTDPKVLAALEQLKDIRAYILSKAPGTLTTVISDKGHGKLLTKMKHNLPVLDEAISNRPSDMVDGRPLLLVDNGAGLVGKDLTEAQEKVAKNFEGTSFAKDGVGIGRVYQAVRTANGSWYVIPVYTKLINESANGKEIVSKIIQSLRDNITSATEINFSKVLSEINKYIFATNSHAYSKNHQALRIKDDTKGQNPGKVTVAGVTVSFTDLKAGVNLTEFEKALGTVRHNLSLNQLNTPDYQSEISDVLVTNAYTSDGQYYVQPYIEIANPEGFGEVDNTEAKPSEDFKNETTQIEDIKTEQKPSFDVDNHTIEDDLGDAFSTNPLGGRDVTEKDIKTLNKILPGIELADAKLVQEVGKNLTDTYGMFHGMLIYLFKGATNKTLYHEAFHGIYRNILSNTERINIDQEARVKYKAPTKEDLEKLQAAQSRILSAQVLEQLYYEEKLADDFAEYADGVLNPSLGQKILNFFKKIFDLFRVFRNSNNEQITKLFESVTSGQLANRSLAAKNDQIDLSKFGQAYSRVFTDGKTPLSAELERTNAIANALLDGISRERSKGVPISKVNINKIANEIKNQYDSFWKEEDSKPEGEKNKNLIAMAYKVVNNFPAILENAKKQISMTRKITIKGDMVEINDVEGTVDASKEQENTTKMEGNTEKGFQDMTAISGIKSTTHEIKLFLSNIPVIKNGVVQKDNYGFTLFYPFEKLYYKLESSLIGTTTFKEQMSVLEDLSKYSFEIKQIYDSLSTNADSNFSQQFAANFNKQMLNYKLVTYAKKKDNFEFKIMDPNRSGVALNLKTQWETSNIQDPTNKLTDDIRTFNSELGVYQIDPKKVEKLVEFYKAKGEITDKGKQLTPKLTVDEVFELANKLGIGLSHDTIELESKVESDGRKSSLESLTDSLLNYAEHKWINPKSTARQMLDRLIKLETSAQTELFTSSFNNVENSVVYAVQHQSFASKLVNKLTNPNSGVLLSQELQRDPMNYKNSILTNRNLLSMFAIDGLKMIGDSSTGKKFNQIDSDDYLAMIINMYINDVASQNITTEAPALYAPIIPAEKGLSFGFTGKKYTVALLEDGTIDPNTAIVQEFKQLFYNELARIRQTMIDRNNLPKEKLRFNYHTDKKGNLFDKNGKPLGLGLQFNLTNAIDSKLKEELDEFLKTTFSLNIDSSTAPDGLKIILSKNKDLMNKVEQALINDLNSIVKDSIDKLKSRELISEKEGKLTSTKIVTKQNLNNLLTEWTLNSYLFNVNSSLLINGDPAFYKGAEDNGKRFYQGYSMLKFADTSTIDNSYKYIKNGQMKINVVSDFEAPSRFGKELHELADITGNENIRNLANEEYLDEKSVNATDAQMFVSVGMYAELQKLFGNSSAELQEGFTNADIANVLNKNSVGILSIMKPFFYGVQWNSEYKRYEPIQVKCSIFPLTNKYTANNPILAKHKALMDANENYPQVIAFESTMKALSPFKAKLQDPSNPSEVVLDLNNFGEQVANPDHMLDSENSSLRQLKMLFYGMVEDDKTYGNKTGREIKNEIAKLDKANIYESLKQVVEGFKGNKRELNEFIQKAITARNSTSIIEKVFELKEDGTFQYPLDLINSKTTIQLISAIFSDEVIRQSFTGGSAVQATAMGLHIAPQKSDYKNVAEFQKAVNESKELSELQTSLKWVRKGEVIVDPVSKKETIISIDYMEVAASYYVKEFINPDGSIKDNIPDEMREMLVYRIPTEGAHSMMPCKVVHFLPSEYKGVILMPLEVTKQFGADFDFDKIFFIAKEYYKTKEGIVPYKYISEEGNVYNIQRYKNLINYTLKNNEEARKLIKEANDETKDFGYVLEHNDKIQILLDNGIIPHSDDFAKLSIEEQNIKPARNNKLLANYNQILRSVNMLESLITPSGPGAIAEVYKKVKKSIDNGNFFTPMYQVYNKDLFHKISMLKGVAALQVSGHAWATEGRLKIKDKVINGNSIEQGVKIWDNNGEMVTRNELSGIISDDNAKIVEELSSMMAVILDAVKTPDQLPSIGISMKTLPVWSYLVRLGLGSKIASQFTSQSAMKDLSVALESNDKQLKGKNFVKKDIKTVKQEYAILYQDALNKALAKANLDLNNKDNFELSEYINKYPLEKVENFDRLSLKELNAFTGLDKSQLGNKKAFEEIKLSNREFGFRAMPEYKKLKYLQMQIAILNTVENSEGIIKELGQLNNLFSINKETGPNFEDVNGKLEIYNTLTSEATVIEGIDALLQSDAIKPYIETVRAEYDVLSKHYNFASPFYNAVKDKLVKSIYGENYDFTRIPAEDREPINGFVQMYLDAENTFKDIYTNEDRVNEVDFINDIKVLLSSKIYPGYVFKTLNNQISEADQAKLKDMTLFQSLEAKNIKNSNVSYLGLKGNRYELHQKELMIDDIRRLYNSKFKPLAIRLIQHSFINTGMYTGVNSYFSLIDPSILQDMGLTNDRQAIRSELQSEYVNPERISPIVDQLIRNNAKKFTKAYDNDNDLFVVSNDGKTITLDTKSKDNRKQEIVHKDGSISKYIRFKLNDDYTPIYKLEEDVHAMEGTSDTDLQITFKQVTYLGQPGKRIEINPFGEVSTEFLNNKYEKFTPIERNKPKTVTTELEQFYEEEGSEDTTENINQSSTGQSENGPLAKVDDIFFEDDLDNSEESGNLGMNTNFNQKDTKC